MLHLHPSLDLLHRGPVRLGVQILQRRPAVHWVLLLGPVKNREQLMQSPAMASGLIGNFPRGADPPATDQHAPPPHIQLPTSSSLRAILAAEFGGRGAQGGASGHRSLRDRGGGGSRSVGSNRYREEATSGSTGAAKRTTSLTKTTAARARRQWSETVNS